MSTTAVTIFLDDDELEAIREFSRCLDEAPNNPAGLQRRVECRERVNIFASAYLAAAVEALDAKRRERAP